MFGGGMFLCFFAGGRLGAAVDAGALTFGVPKQVSKERAEQISPSRVYVPSLYYYPGGVA